MANKDVLVQAMETVSWQVLQQVDPEFAQQYLDDFRNLSIGPAIFWQARVLQERMANHIHTLVQQRKFPDYFEIKRLAQSSIIK